MARETENLNFKSKDFVHLHLHSDYSLLQSTIQLKPLAKRLNELEMRACAITDYANLYGAVSFYNAMKYAGVRPIVGYEAMLTFGSRFDRSTSLTAGERPYYHLLLLAKDLTGYQNLVHLASMAFTEGFYFKPRIDIELLAEKSGGLIAIPALKDGPVTHFLQNGNDEIAQERLEQFADIFGKENLYLEIQDGDDQLVKRIVEFSKKTGTPLVATNDAHYLDAEDARAHEVLLCIGEGKTVSGESSGEYAGRHVRSSDEMWAIFGNELPESLTNTLKIAETCALSLPLGGNLTLPTYPIPTDATAATTNEYFEYVLKQGFEERKREVWEPMQSLGKLKYDLDAYQKRLEIEIGTINQMGFAGYFLIVWDFIKYAKEKGIPVGPGRGSAAGSLAAYCMRITDVDPLQYDLLFERFLNPERISMPDIDIDFCIRGRGDVIEHVTEFYGRESVCQIITFGTMASKAAIKDVGRALNMPYGEVEKIAKMIPPPYRGRNISISQALEQVPELSKAFKTDPQVKELVDLALRLEGCARHTSVHAAGVVISPKPLHEIVPVSMSSKNELTSQYTMNDLEKVGMLKMDFLALTTLTVISDCLESLKQKSGVAIDWNEVSLNDEKTMALFGEGKTEAIFQFESSGMQEICRRLKPKELEDLSALNALYRPGPLDGGMIEDFILRHRGDKPVRYLVPQMKDILSNTYGVLVYQEQIMQLAQQLAGYSLGEADMMRRAMGKKKREEMAVHSEKFVNGAVERGIPKAKAEEIFNLMSQFADYGFNRSHSIAYAYLAFQTAYLKAHYPAYFYASVLSHESQDSAKVYKYSNELRSIGLKLLPPDINESDDGFTPLDGAVRFGLNAIKGIGSSSVSSILVARKLARFTSLFDFVSRIDQGSLNRRGMESLVSAGAFDSLDPDGSSTNVWRAKLYESIDNVLLQGQRIWKDKQRGQNALFGGDQSDALMSEAALPDVEPWSQIRISKEEKAAIGFYLSVHPLDNYAQPLADLSIPDISESAAAQPGETHKFAGIISGAQAKFSKKGNRFCIFRLEDRSGGLKCIAWGEAFSKLSELIKDDELVVAEGRIEAGEGQDITLIVSDVKRLGETILSKAREASVTFPDNKCDTDFLERVFAVLSGNPGDCDVYLSFAVDDVALKVHSGPLRIQGSTRVEKDLAELGCRVVWQ